MEEEEEEEVPCIRSNYGTVFARRVSVAPLSWKTDRVNRSQRANTARVFLPSASPHAAFTRFLMSANIVAEWRGCAAARFASPFHGGAGLSRWGGRKGGGTRLEKTRRARGGGSSPPMKSGFRWVSSVVGKEMNQGHGR